MIESGAIHLLTPYLVEKSYKKVAIVADANTYEVAERMVALNIIYRIDQELLDRSLLEAHKVRPNRFTLLAEKKQNAKSFIDLRFVWIKQLFWL
ncbi:MAG: hypothetical protein WD469_13895 [Paenibacillaceae bacterium]